MFCSFRCMAFVLFFFLFILFGWHSLVDFLWVHEVHVFHEVYEVRVSRGFFKLIFVLRLELHCR